MKHIINGVLGIWLAATWAAAFLLFLTGHYLYEPNKIIAIIELAVSLIITGWFVIQFIRSFKEPKKGRGAVERSEG